MSKELSTVQKNLIAEVVKQGKVEPACKQAGIAKSTYYEWLKTPEFEHELKKQQDEVYESSITFMKYLFTKAIETQEELLNSKDERIRLRASNAIINNTLKILEAKSLKDRLNALEKNIEEMEDIGNIKRKFSGKNRSISFDSIERRIGEAETWQKNVKDEIYWQKLKKSAEESAKADFKTGNYTHKIPDEFKPDETQYSNLKCEYYEALKRDKEQKEREKKEKDDAYRESLFKRAEEEMKAERRAQRAKTHDPLDDEPDWGNMTHAQQNAYTKYLLKNKAELLKRPG